MAFSIQRSHEGCCARHRRWVKRIGDALGAPVEFLSRSEILRSFGLDAKRFDREGYDLESEPWRHGVQYEPASTR
jgi:hypothetical protein